MAQTNIKEEQIEEDVENNENTSNNSKEEYVETLSGPENEDNHDHFSMRRIKVSKQVSDATYVEQWVNRRRMAWLSLISMLVFTAFALFYIPEPRLKAAENVLTWYYFSMGTVVCTYMGLSTWASISRTKL